MKKIIVALFFFTIIFLVVSKEENKILIPKDAIRFRIIASSNNLNDQLEKIKIKEELTPIIDDILTTSNSKEETKELINYNMESIKTKISKYNPDYQVDYGMHYFPEKVYKGVTYKEGEYESLVITLGDGNGDNWWCVLFPPLCLLEAKEEELDDITYSFYIKDVLNKYLK